MAATGFPWSGAAGGGPIGGPPPDGPPCRADSIAVLRATCIAERTDKQSTFKTRALIKKDDYVSECLVPRGR